MKTIRRSNTEQDKLSSKTSPASLVTFDNVFLRPSLTSLDVKIYLSERKKFDFYGNEIEAEKAEKMGLSK